MRLEEQVAPDARRRRWVVVAGVVLLAFGAWAVGLAVSASALRTRVEQRVGWLRTLSLGAESASKRQQLEQELRRAGPVPPPVSEALTAWVSAADPGSPEAVAASRTVIAAVRAETGALSEQLGARWDSINVLAGLSLLLALVTLGLLVRSERVAEALAASERETRRLAEERLADQRRHFREVLDLLPEGVLLLNGDQVVFANRAVGALLGDLVPAEERSLAGALGPELGAVVQRPREGPEDVSRTVAGRRRVFEVSPGEQVAFDGADSTLFLLRDVTEARELALRLRLNDRLVAVGTLAAGVAHEINNPLTAAITNLMAARDLAASAQGLSGEERDELIDCLSDTQDATRRVATITRDLKTLSRPRDDLLEPVDVERALESTLNLVRAQLTGVELERRFGGVKPVLSNEARLGQVFVNLLINAAQACAGRPGARVVLSTSMADGLVQVEVSDNGPGIAPEVKERIFDAFFTTKDVGQGTGLGLSICHTLVKGMGGAIGVDSALGVGTTFRVSLPGLGADDLPTLQ